jgi:hypothetical protein
MPCSCISASSSFFKARVRSAYQRVESTLKKESLSLSLSLSLFKSGDFPESAIPSRENNNDNKRRRTKENRGEKRVVVVAVAATEHEW